MQIQSKFHYFKNMRIVLGNQAVEKFCGKSVLLVGVGGIGCEVLKNLSKFPIKNIVIIDLDVIELSNLNRQFYFRKQHINQSKAKVAKDQVLKIVPDLNIEAIEGSIYDRKYDNYHFYSQFDLVISALDNIKARQHLAKNCTKYGKVLIDAGTSGFNGQSYPSVRFLTSCHNCYPSTQEQSFAVCTIRTRPQRSIHCAVYAKNLYEQFFGQQSEDFLHKEIRSIKQKLFTKTQSKQVEIHFIQRCGQELFDYLFHDQLKIQNQKVSTFQWKAIAQMKDKFLINLNQHEIQDKQLPLQIYANIFMVYFVKLVERKLNRQNESSVPQFYDKDDQHSSLFVFALTNLRILNFQNQSQSKGKMKLLTHQQTRKFLGKLIPAIASTNSIAAALQVNQLKDYFVNNKIDSKYITISPFNHWLSLPNPLCEYCSPKNFYFRIKCNLSQRTFQEFEQFALKNCFSFGRDLHCGSLVLIKNLNAQKTSVNKKKFLNFKPDLLIQNTLTVHFLPTSKLSNLKIEIILINDEVEKIPQKNFILLNTKDIQFTIQASEAKQMRQTEKSHHEKSDQDEEKDELKDWQEINVE